MGNPTLTLPVTPTIAQGNAVVISGITYYGSNTILTFAARSFELKNIYNTISNYGTPPSFNYITITDSRSTPVSRAASTLQYGVSPYSGFPAPSEQNVTYYNSASVTFTLNGNNITGSTASGNNRLSYALLNALGKTAAGTLYTPTANPQTYIGYISSTWTSSLETNIPLNQASQTTIAGVTAQTRMSISNSQITTPETPALENIVAFNNATLTTRDPAYNPYDGYFYANNFSLSNYILPATPSFTGGTKYLLIRLTNTAPLPTFTIRLATSIAPAVSNVYVYWRDTINSTNYGWYDAKKDRGLTGGCQNGVVNSYTYPIQINLAAAANYYLPSAGGGFIYLNIEYTGVIALNQIVVT